MSLIASDQLKIVIGLGVTGISCVELLVANGDNFIVLDTRRNPPKLKQFQKDYPQVKVILGDLDKELLASASELIISPGIAKDDPNITYAVESGVKLVGDIDLFCREVTAPIIAITGSNAKTTVTTLIGEMAVENGIDVGVGGNIGLPVLEFLKQPQKQLYVLELSSFQLETTHELRADVATVLNITPDHLDRYDNDFQQYYQAKHRIFRGCKSVVENLDDSLTHPLLPANVKVTGYRLGRSDFNVFGLLDITEAAEGEGQDKTESYFALAGKPLMATSEVKLPGKHNIINALSALAIGHSAGFEMPAMLKAIREFSGLEHRCQLVANKSGVQYFDDSKGTNVGATVAAIEGLGSTLQENKKIVLIAGGDGKGAAFDELVTPIESYVKSVVLIGTDAQRIAEVLPNSEIYFAKSMQQAVDKSASLTQSGDVVLLSPACASFDMFDNYGQRGDVFSEAARGL
jgi:UDP-N-acetylmuramoylalanine--D-glutamate ligase